MSTTLVDVADAAYPFDYGRLPSSVRVVLSYVGESGCTPHVWSTQEVAAVRKAGLAWAPIIVPPQRALTVTDGHRAAQVMAAALPQYGYAKGLPVFIDVERGSYDADPDGARGAVAAWRADMGRTGWPDAYTYWPLQTSYTWLPSWVSTRPAKLPGSCIGQQWQGEADGGRYDLSIFDARVFSELINDMGGAGVSLDKTDQQFIVNQLQQVQQNLADMINALHVGKGGNHEWAANMTAVLHAVTATTTTADGGGLTDAQVTALSTSLAAELSRSLPQAVVKALSAALAN